MDLTIPSIAPPCPALPRSHHAVNHGHPDQPWAYRVDADVAGGIFKRGALGKADHTVLGSVIVGAFCAISFLLGFVIALVMNYPRLNLQKERMLAHAGNAMVVVLLVFAAGVFARIFSGTKMVDASAQLLVNTIPPSWGHLFPLVVAITSMPLTFLLSNDAYYFGLVPILANAAAAYGISPIEIARASVLGQPVHQISPLVASTLLLVGMIDRDLGDFQKTTIKWAVLPSLLMTGVSLLTGAITLFT